MERPSTPGPQAVGKQRSPSRTAHRTWAALAALLVGGLMASAFDDDAPGPPPEACPVALIGLAAEPYVNGLPLALQTLEIVGEAVKVVVETRPACNPVTPAGLPFEWEATGPGGPISLSDAGTLRPYFVPPAAGAYEARITYCRHTCWNVAVDGDVVNIPAQTATFQFEVVEEVPLPPATQPVLTPSALRSPTDAEWDAEESLHATREMACAYPGYISVALGAQLVTVRPWTGPGDYRLLEGTVRASRIAGKDNELNHTSHDIAIHVEPDPQHRELMLVDRDDMEVEWESLTFPGPFRPLPGDRISAWGFHVFDCHHSPYPTEIHPPVLTAVHRSRPIRLPDGWAPPGGQPLGDGVYFPGIVTDIYANRHAGEMTSNCSTTGLHQPAAPAPWPAIVDYGECIESPHPLDRVFTFNIYLPPDPRKRMAQAGVNAPPAPLYVDIVPGPGPVPVVTPAVDDNNTPEFGDDVVYLSVSLDLTGYGQSTYARRISAGWVQPNPDNWGLEQWKLGIESLEVYEDHDLGTDGNWIFWVSLNNRDREWSRLLNDNSVGEGTHTFGGRPWETGIVGDRSLGPHVLLFHPRFAFPGMPERDMTQSVQLAASGYDAEFSDDALGFVNTIWHPDPTTWAVGHRQHGTTRSSTGDYDLNYFVERVGPMPPADLSDAGQSLADAYTIRPAGARCTRVGRSLCVLFPEIDGAAVWHPVQVPVGTGASDLAWYDHPIYRPQGAEEQSLTGISLENLGRAVLGARSIDPERVERFFRELREEFDQVRDTPLESEFARVLSPLEAHLPADRWQFHFGSIDPTPVDLAVRRLLMSPEAVARRGVVFSAEIVNQGTGAAAPFMARLEVDGRTVGTVPLAGLAAGTTTTVDFPAWLATAGTHGVRAVADSEAAIGEPSEVDNTLERRFLVDDLAHGLPDLQVSAVRLHPRRPRARHPAKVVATVHNGGGNTLDAFVVRFVVDRAVVGEVTVAGLPATEHVQVTSPPWPVVRAPHTVLVVVDALDAVGEADESNNQRERTFLRLR